MDKYTELYAWIWKAFGRETFSLDRLRATFPTSQAPKVAHDLIKRGYLRQAGRGIYEAVEPSDFMEKITAREADLGLAEKSGKVYAFCGSTAVSMWTDGYYWTGFTIGYRPIHLTIRKKDSTFWRRFLRKAGIKFAFEGESKTLFGEVFALHPKERFAYEEKEGLKVIPLDEAVQFCLKHELVYEPALEYLDQKYHIGYGHREHMI
jgi:hypothetical protein